MFKPCVALAFFAGLAALPAEATTVNVDLSGAVTGSLISGVGASFAQSFAGQAVAGIGVTGSPTNPLALNPSGEITVAFWDSGLGAASNSLLSQPGNVAPLSGLLASAADSLAFTSGSGDGGTTFDIAFYNDAGALVGARTVITSIGYADYSLTGLAAFKGFTIFNNSDSFGLRFQNFSYNSAANVPEPASWAMLLVGFGAIGFGLRSRRTEIRFG